MFALVDCNNFYASCERLFRPDLYAQPIIVLSSNDGCVIARSNEAKNLGIKMSEPFFKIKGLCERHNVQVFSSNFALYGDISKRVMFIIQESWQDIEVYSIDEAFLRLETLDAELHNDFCSQLQRRILKETGIPTTIGIGQTKTLAKAASHIGKKICKAAVFNIYDQPSYLAQLPAADIWGIGRATNKKLNNIGIYTALDLMQTPYSFLKKNFNKLIVSIAMELRGIVCSQLEEITDKKTIMSSQSFRKQETDYSYLEQALSSHCMTVYEKLRKQNSLVTDAYIFILTNRFRKDLPQHHEKIAFAFEQPTDDIRIITHTALLALKKIFKPHYHYKKLGICLTQLLANNQHHHGIFDTIDTTSLEKTKKVLDIFDTINAKFGRHSIKLASTGLKKGQSSVSVIRSPHYTTSWSSCPSVKNAT